MSGTGTRELAAQVCIVLALCVGGWMMLVQPKINSLQEIEATISQSQDNAAGLSQDTIERMADQISGLKQRVSDVEDNNQLAADSSQLYGVIMGLAERHRVTIKTLQPGAGQEFSPDERVGRTHIEMALEGQWDATSSFLSAVNGLEGFVRPIALSLTPMQNEAGESLVASRFSCEAMSFTMPESLSELRGSVDADR